MKFRKETIAIQTSDVKLHQLSYMTLVFIKLRLRLRKFISDFCKIIGKNRNVRGEQDIEKYLLAFEKDATDYFYKDMTREFKTRIKIFSNALTSDGICFILKMDNNKCNPGKF